VFQAKKQYLYSKIWEFGGEWGQGVKIYSRKCQMAFGIADPDLPIHYATFMGLG